jgi:hypothetical protein
MNEKNEDRKNADILLESNPLAKFARGTGAANENNDLCPLLAIASSPT